MEWEKGFIDSLGAMKKETEGHLAKALTPEVLAAMSPEQKKMMDKFSDSFEMGKGMSIDEMSNKINKNLEYVTSLIK